MATTNPSTYQEMGCRNKNLLSLDRLLAPAIVLAIKFQSNGLISVSQAIANDNFPNDSTYDFKSDPSWIVKADQSNLTAGQQSLGLQSVGFEIGVLSGSSGGASPMAAIVERDDEWVNPWDDEIVRIIGGSSFPLGDHVTPPTQGGTNKFPLPCIKGNFTGPFDNTQDGAVVNLVSSSRNSTATLSSDLTAKYFSLLLPDTVSGYIRLSLPDNSLKIFKSNVDPTMVLVGTRSKNLFTVQSESASTSIRRSELRLSALITSLENKLRG